MANKSRLISAGGWAGSAGAVTGDHIVDNITALAGGANDATTPVLTGDVNLVTVCATASDSVRLPRGVPGDEMWVRNSGAATLNVFPTLGGRINDAAVDGALPLATKKSAHFKAIGSQDWITTS